MEHPTTHPSPYRVSESLPSFPRTNVSPEVATKAIEAVAEVCGVTIDGLRDIRDAGSDFNDSIRLDSLLNLQVIHTLIKLGIRIPGSATGAYLGQKSFEGFLESFILECFDTVDRAGS